MEISLLEIDVVQFLVFLVIRQPNPKLPSAHSSNSTKMATTVFYGHHGNCQNLLRGRETFVPFFQLMPQAPQWVNLRHRQLLGSCRLEQPCVRLSGLKQGIGFGGGSYHQAHFLPGLILLSPTQFPPHSQMALVLPWPQQTLFSGPEPGGFI